MRKQAGFTLIELIVVIVLLGILGVTATARFQDLSAQAEQAATNGVAAELSGGAAINYATYVASGGANGVDISDTNANNCTDAIFTQLLTGGLPTGYTVSGNTGDCSAAGDAFTCTLTGGATTTATINGICTGP